MDFSKAMNALVKKDISDILQVNIPSWFTVGFSNGWNMAWLRQLDLSSIQQVGSIMLIFLSSAYTLFKMYRAYQHYRWERQDRLEEKGAYAEKD